MKVRFIGRPGRLEDGTRRGHGFLTVGRDYVVLSVRADSHGITLLIVADDGTPGWDSVDGFDLVSAMVPSNWTISIGANGRVGEVELAPEPWLEPGFFESYWAGGGEATVNAQAVFERERERIMRESE